VIVSHSRNAALIVSPNERRRLAVVVDPFICSTQGTTVWATVER
jgi:hypothetical protein